MNKHDGIKINQKADLRQAMVEMSEKTLTLLIVVGEYDKVVGVITDGDIRRFLLSHGELSALVEECMTIKFSFVSKEYEREEVI